jgi:tetrapyrrole methylase family protein/MazG family protein
MQTPRPFVLEANVAEGVLILGLGPGDPMHLTRRAWEILQSAEEIVLRTRQHPAVAAIPGGVRIESFDALYDSAESFEALYDEIIGRVVELGKRPQGVVYAVPGSPSVGEATVSGLRAACTAAGLACHEIPGLSFIEPCLELLGVDAFDGLTLVDALDLAAAHHPAINPDQHALIGQLYSRSVASDVKLCLGNQYPDDYPVVLIHAAGAAQAELEALPLYAIDGSPKIAHLTALYLPPLAQPSSFEALQQTIARLRAPDGCPWDRQQTHASLRSHLLQETYEALQAIDRNDMEALTEELGDLLLQIVLQAQIGTEDGEFMMPQVIGGIRSKLIRRHPHVFGGLAVEGVTEVLHNWEALKAEERRLNGDAGKSALQGVPEAIPALAQAAELQDRAARLGFDWKNLGGVLEKLREELDEVARAGDDEALGAELGDLLFSLVNYVRWLQLDSESLLRQANHRFRGRFETMERLARQAGTAVNQMDPEVLDRLWELAKREFDSEGPDADA